MRWTATAALALAVSVPACSLPIPKTRNIARSGTLTTKRPRLAEIRPGVSTEDELRRTLEPFVTGASSGGFFWARWEEAMFPYEWHGEGGSDREWKIVNVLARFHSGAVADYRVCTERKLVECLFFFAGRVTPPALDNPPVPIRAYRYAKMWGPDRFAGNIEIGVNGAALRGQVSFDAAWSDVEQIHVNYGSSAQMLALRLHFTHEIQRVDYVDFAASPASTWKIVGALAADSLRRLWEGTE